MKPLEIESWALRVLQLVESRQRVEDLKVELKSEWPTDFNKTARQLAGHANFARGENILWLIGADEKQGVIRGANYADLASWFQQVQSPFESVYPSLAGDMSVAYKGKTVAALCFDTSRFPYLVQNPAFGRTAGDGVQFEVPWREGTRTRTATRNELVLMLGSLGTVPKVEILYAEAIYVVGKHWNITLAVYVVPLGSATLTYPFHKTSAVLTVENERLADEFVIMLDTPEGKHRRSQQRWTEWHKRHETIPESPPARTEIIEATRSELVIRGCGRIEIEGTAETQVGTECETIQLQVTLIEAASDSRILLSATLTKQAGGTEQAWRYDPPAQ
ncbi:MAG TPA: hypothetical protein P5205_14560 [Candidatus Paceibacterota bacterium]|nr:hypothetical protein [Verrucomicrobiota bacterium]HSA11585.1 hypothetical protein [Candidatus Paceibacterota bacterium]